MWKLFLSVVKKQITSPIKAAKKFFKAPKRAIKKRVSAPSRSIKAQIKKGRRLGRMIRLISPKQRLIEETYKKAKIVTALTDEQNLLLESKTSTTVSSTEVSKELAESNKALRGRSTEEIRSINKTITKELEGMGLDSTEKIEKVIEDAEFRQDIVNTNSYESFMDQWKDGFFGYKPEEDGISDDERQAIWDQIEANRTFEDFVERKVL